LLLLTSKEGETKGAVVGHSLQWPEGFQSLERHQRQRTFPNVLLVAQVIPVEKEDTTVHMGKQ
jgi:hypothetical protein